MADQFKGIPMQNLRAEVKGSIEKLQESSEKQELFEPIESTVGGVGRWQIIICLAITLLKIPVAFHQLGIIFLAPPANFKCTDPLGEEGKCSSNCTNYDYDKKIFSNTIVMEWDLVCDKEWMKNMTQTVFMFGVLLGNMLFGFLADRFGRRYPLLLAVFLQTVAGVSASLAWNWLSFTIIRFILALSTGGTMITGFVITMEMVGVKHRQLFSMLFQIPFNIGHAIMVGIAYLTRDSWSSFQLWVSIPTVILFAYYWMIPESPRWLLAVGKTEEAIKILEKGAGVNKLPISRISYQIENYQKMAANLKVPKGTMIDLFRTPNMRRKTIILCFGWMSCGICFFGVSQYVGQLVGNIFINVVISALIQIPGTVLAIFLNNRLGRKKTLIGAYFLSGIPLVGIAIIPEAWSLERVILSLIGIFGMSLSFPTIYLFAGEVFPTVLRNTGMGLCSMLARVGSMISPFLAGLESFKYWLPPVLFGSMPMLAAILTIFLPETHDRVLPNTLEEAENFENVKKNEKPEA
ncbi:organic cation transporter protein-like isoform X2 [Arctopsyche grandis]|uniref:organic cation transporter protein-like isoform X2 n=1 Tax=Arctopsyche grandis TaxID=121162 RepID=UPI00406D6EE3